ncbi:MAG: glycosyl hydrolase family 88 [Anaerolineae bacterium]|nr:glycoside hydrolase family 88 protein [Anaerolineales bacterium]MCQ3976591.1 glycosyl hydrolase family 88 [Anaerolineae bacterium]
MADSVLKRHPLLADKWRYEAGVVLTGIQQVWLKTQEQKYYDYIKSNIDQFIGPDGDIQTYCLEEYNLDQINEGKLLFLLYNQTGDERYRQAAYLLRKQLQTQPRTSEGGFWHKQIYPHQMWLDGLYMAAPFLAEFAQTFAEPEGFDEVVKQIMLIERHTRDPQTGLLYHGWDESKRQRWANPETGCSSCFWGRAVGWTMLAIVDVLDFLPQHHAGRESLLAIFERTASALAAVQDKATGLWYQVLDQGDMPGNYLEASASAMFVYAFAKGIRQGHIGEKYQAVATQGYQGILERFVEIDAQGLVNLNGICAVAGLGGEPYRDGSFEYYIGEEIATNDYKGVGPFIMASVEMER